jgi:hypothetical protein
MTILGRFAMAMLMGLAMAGPAYSATIDGYSLPDVYPLPGQSLVLNGIGIRTLTIFRVRVYVAGLYVTQKTTDAAALMSSPEPEVVLMQFLRSASKSTIEKQYREGEEKNCGHGECPPGDQPDFEHLVAATPARAVGQTLAYIITSKGLELLADNKLVVSIDNPGLAKRILAGFIGPNPPSSELKARLLGIAE